MTYSLSSSGRMYLHQIFDLTALLDEQANEDFGVILEKLKLDFEFSYAQTLTQMGYLYGISLIKTNWETSVNTGESTADVSNLLSQLGQYINDEFTVQHLAISNHPYLQVWNSTAYVQMFRIKANFVPSASVKKKLTEGFRSAEELKNEDRQKVVCVSWIYRGADTGTTLTAYGGGVYAYQVNSVNRLTKNFSKSF